MDNQIKCFHLQKSQCLKFKLSNSNSGIDVDNDDDLKIEIKILQYSESKYSSIIWPSADLLCRFILANHSEFIDKSILELGSGTGICGIMAAKIGAKVIVTEQTLDASELIEKNLQLNHVNARFVKLDWALKYDLIDNVNIFENIDYIIGSDLCYEDENQYEKLLLTVSFIMKNNQKKSIPFYMTYHLRNSNHHIQCLLLKYKLKCELLFISENMDIYLYRITQLSMN